MNDTNNTRQLRKEYSEMPLLESEALKSPFEQFELWFNQILKTDVEDPYVMLLSTIDENVPCARIVLLKEYSKEGFGFYTNYNSPKALQIEANNHVSLTFFWAGIDRQIRVKGIAVKTSKEKSDEYFKTRQEISRAGTWSSLESFEIEDRESLEDSYAQNIEYKSAAPLVRPEYWGGYIVKPTYFEFWQGRKYHINDRLAYTLQEENGLWKIKRLSP